MSTIVVEIAIILALLLVNGVFAMSEMAVVAAKKVRLEHRAEEGDAGARAALDLAAHPTNFLSTVQVGITLVGVLAGAFGGAGIAERLAPRFATVGWLAPYAEPAAFALVVAAITYLSLILGELVPKRIALGNPERIAALVARPMRLIARAGAPLVRLLTGSTNLVFRLIGIRAAADGGVTEQDIRAMVEQGAESGVVQPSEHEIVENAFRLGDRQVGSIMTPRPDLSWVDVSGTPEEIREQLVLVGGARFLVCESSVERVVGVARAQDVLARCLRGEPLDLRAVLHQPLYVPTTMPAYRLLDELRRSRAEAAVVLDEFGGVQGLATLEDLVEALVGAMPVRGDTSPPDVARQADGSWLVDGAVALEVLEDALDLAALPEADRRGYRTVAGLVMSRLGHVPVVDESVDVGGRRFVVDAMDGRRIARVRVPPTVVEEARP